MSYFCFLSVQTVSFCGHIARYGQWSLHPLRFASPPFRGGVQPLSADILPSKQIQKSDSGNFQNPPLARILQSYNYFLNTKTFQLKIFFKGFSPCGIFVQISTFYPHLDKIRFIFIQISTFYPHLDKNRWQFIEKELIL